MAKYNVTANTTMTAEKAGAKAELMSVIENALKAHYGEDVVMWVRSTGSSPKNEIGVIVGDIADSGYEYDMTFTVDCTCKPYKDGKRGKSIVEAYDIYKANAEYEAYLTDKATKKAEAETRKAERKARGSKSKAEKDAEKAKKSAELDAVSAKIEAKRKAEEEAKRYVVVINPGRGSAPFVFARDTEDTERCTRTLENAKAWKDTLEMDYPDGTAKIYEADMWYRNNG